MEVDQQKQILRIYFQEQKKLIIYGDDFNEVFLPVFSSGFDPSDYTLYIFNRWGDLIFESHDPKVGWKGTFGAEGNLVQDDTYTWKIIYKHKNDKKKNVVVGHVNVLK